MGEAFRLGGWGMYPTTIVGVVLIVMATRYAARPDQARLHAVRCLSVLTFFVSCLGFVTGVIKTFSSIDESVGPELGNFVVMGVGESLNNLGLGLTTLVMAWAAVSVGAARSRASSRDAELIDPQAR